MDKRPYQFPAADQDHMYWAFMHDERMTFNLSDPSLPQEFIQNIKDHYVEQKWCKADGFAEVAHTQNLVCTATFACDKCGVAGAALTGWDTGRNNKGLKWGCFSCYKNWDRESPASVVLHIQHGAKSFSFFSYWPLSYFASKHWPEVHIKMLHLAIKRTTWYYKYSPLPPLRDVPPADNPAYRIRYVEPFT